MDTENFIFFLILAFVAANLYILYSARKAVDQFAQIMKEQLDKIIREVKIERVGNMTYWYDKETDQFIAQGTTNAEITATLKQRWSKNMFLADNMMWMAPDFEPLTLEQFQKNLNERVNEQIKKIN
jgi:hypothetical protein